MPLYEHIVMMRPDVSGAQVETLIEQFKGVIEADSGSIAKSEYWGLRPIAYKIKKNRKAHYALMNINAPHAAANTDSSVRFMTMALRE